MNENNTENELAPRQRLAIEALVAGSTVVDAARAAGVNSSTVHRWRRDERFMAALRELEGEALRRLGRRVLALGDAAADALRDALGEYQPIGARLRAADLVTSRGPQLAELTAVIERLEELEARINDTGGD